jgi:hypothetical protein
MPVARFLRLLITLVVLVIGPLSALGCGFVGETERQPVDARPAARAAKRPLPPSTKVRDEHTANAQKSAGTARVRLATTDVGGPATSTGTDTWRAPSRGRAGLLSILSRMLAGSSTVEGGEDNEFEVGDGLDLVDDDGPQGSVAAAFSGPSIQGLPALCVESNLLAIQPSIGHPRGDDEPPRV